MKWPGAPRFGGAIDRRTLLIGGGAGIGLDAGDAMQGTVISNLTKGRSMVDVLNRLGVAAALHPDRAAAELTA